jgi:hypothetical protein
MLDVGLNVYIPLLGMYSLRSEKVIDEYINLY